MEPLWPDCCRGISLASSLSSTLLNKEVSKGVVLLKNLEWVPLAWFFLDSQATVWYLRSMVDSHPGVGGGWRELYILPKAQPHRGVNV